MVEKVLKLFVLGSYLFCMGLELLGGILLKLETIFLNGFLFACKSLKACEVEALFDTEVVDGDNSAANAPTLSSVAKASSFNGDAL
ncbi:hypothetical protein POTOM_013474 [Populus tomentosa]|uniref:Uncharacterized protein n=1 Tax=Populus tomentosa TaxID=118781 RepID=A0A8X8A0S3_POPTO|nr:hypothetical protein POTOM_013474 [Populus tomentosa]